MKISKQTLNVLKNFSSINGSILISPGKQLATVSPASNVFARFSCEEDFPVEIPIYDLNDMLASIGLVEDADIEFKSNNMLIVGKDQKMKYVYSDPSVITAPPQISEEMLENPKVSFNLPVQTLDKVIRASGIVGGDTLSFYKDLSGTKMIAGDRFNPDSNKFEIEIPNVLCSEDFNIMVLVENFKMLSLDYEVRIFDNFVQFKNATTGIEYILASETDSTWG